ncbi:MAG: ABC transporter ATP-binding protein, partial [Planctomycetota bacterium]
MTLADATQSSSQSSDPTQQAQTVDYRGTAPSIEDALIRVENLQTYFGDPKNPDKALKAVDDVSFEIKPGETFCVVGESGSGKSITALSIMQLVPQPPGFYHGGRVLFRGTGDLMGLGEKELRKIRGSRIGMIFQEPMTSLNPVFTVGMQVAETVVQHEGLSWPEARARAAQVLEAVGIPGAEKRLDEYPHQFSGGMRQRVMIAMALICNPALLIADEPTTALD